MLYLIYQLIKNYVLPTLTVIGTEGFKLVMITVIILAGIILIFASVGVHIHHGLGTTVVDGIFRGIGWIFRQIIRFFTWLFRTISNLIRREYTAIYTALKTKGLNTFLSGLIAGLTSVITLIVII